MWPFTKIEKRLDQLQDEISELRLRVKKLENNNNVFYQEPLKQPVATSGVFKTTVSFTGYGTTGDIIQKI
jgi:hypothetical protein